MRASARSFYVTPIAPLRSLDRKHADLGSEIGQLAGSGTRAGVLHLRRRVLRLACNNPPIIVIATRTLHGVSAPALLKFVIFTLLSSIASFGLSAAVFQRIPLLRRICERM